MAQGGWAYSGGGGASTTSQSADRASGWLVRRAGPSAGAVNRVAAVAIYVIGVIAVIAAFTDRALHGRQLIHLSLIMYFATPLGLGRYWVRLLDKRPATQGLRELTWLIAAAAFGALALANGDSPVLRRGAWTEGDVAAIIESINWYGLGCTVFAVTALADPISARRSRSGGSLRIKGHELAE
jgi:hypothetical protein